ncbi:MAG: LptF/LptG family permease, partial [Sulfurimonadaceae bacterium]|nr:LptF/LptG family permease [Sulfurimonadaceae bacterium]
MDKIKHYLISHFSILFFSIFLALFAIASIVFMVRIAHMTSVITLNLYELFLLYLYILPELLFFTLPITFFVAAALALHKLSVDNEMVVIFALGIKPAFIYRTLLKPAVMLSVIMIFNFIVVIPHTKMLS